MNTDIGLVIRMCVIETSFDLGFFGTLGKGNELGISDTNQRLKVPLMVLL